MTGPAKANRRDDRTPVNGEKRRRVLSNVGAGCLCQGIGPLSGIDPPELPDLISGKKIPKLDFEINNDL